MLDLDTVAARLNVTKAHVRRMIHRGDLKGIRLGPRTVRVPESELRRLLGGYA